MGELVCGVATRRRQTRSHSQPTHRTNDDRPRMFFWEGTPPATSVHRQKGHS
jgi:hypothetical protein